MQSAVDHDAICAAVAPAECRASVWRRFPCALLIGFLFVLPHLVRMSRLGTIREYTPFSVTTPSNVVGDESFLYAAQANTTLQQHRRADDTDSWEHRDSAFPYSILPATAEAGVAAAIAPGHPRGGLAIAQILFHFAFPCAMAWMLMALLGAAEIPEAMSATLALVVMVVSFSGRTLTYGVLYWLGAHSDASLVQTLQAARSPNPNVSFVLLLAAILLTLRAMRIRSLLAFAAAGLAGSLLFYAYTFYAISWCAACGMLTLLSFWPAAGISRRFFWTAASSAAGGIPFLLWTHSSKVSGAYYERVARLGMIYTHSISPQDLQLTLSWGAAVIVLLCCGVWLRSRTPESERRDAMQRTVLIVAAVALGGLAGLNMQLVTGFDIQSEFHFTHMVIQPATVLLGCLLAAWWLQTYKQPAWTARAAFALLWAVCAASQAAASIESAPFHRLQASDEALFDWLKTNSALGSVVATTNLRVCAEMPIYTHNRLLVVDGTRAAGSDEELLERLLLANRLAGNSADVLTAELMSMKPNPDGVRIETYGSYLFEHSRFLQPGTWHLTEAALPAVLQRYRQLDVAQALGRYRVDYLYTSSTEAPGKVAGWTFVPLLHTAEATLWSLRRDGMADSAASVSPQ